MARKPRGMTTAEYVLVLAAIALAVYGTYSVMSSNVGSLISAVDLTLTVGSHRAPAAQSTPKP